MRLTGKPDLDGWTPDEIRVAQTYFVRMRREQVTGHALYVIANPQGIDVGSVSAYPDGRVEFFDARLKDFYDTREQDRWLVAVAEFRKWNAGIWP